MLRSVGGSPRKSEISGVAPSRRADAIGNTWAIDAGVAAPLMHQKARNCGHEETLAENLESQ